MVVAKCPNLEVVAIDIDIDDAIKVDKNGRIQQSTREAMLPKYEFTKICPRKHARLKTFRYRWVGKDHRKKKQLATQAIDEIRSNLNRVAVKVVEMWWE